MPDVQVTRYDVNLILVAAVFFGLGYWYVRANGQWIAALQAQDPRVRTDPASDPVDWLTSAPYLLRALPARLLRPDPEPTVERLRLQTRNRFAIWISTAVAVLLLGGPVVSLVGDMARTALAKYPTTFGIGGLTVLLLVAGYYLAVLVRALRRVGNGDAVNPATIIFGIAGIGGALLGLMLFATVDMTRR